MKKLKQSNASFSRKRMLVGLKAFVIGVM